MTNPSEIIKLAWQRVQEAEVLCANKMYDGAFYLAGYSVELMLKAKIPCCLVPGMNQPDISLADILNLLM